MSMTLYRKSENIMENSTIFNENAGQTDNPKLKIFMEIMRTLVIYLLIN